MTSLSRAGKIREGHEEPLELKPHGELDLKSSGWSFTEHRTHNTHLRAPYESLGWIADTTRSDDVQRKGFRNPKGWAHEGSSGLASRIGLRARQEQATEQVTVMIPPADLLFCTLSLQFWGENWFHSYLLRRRPGYNSLLTCDHSYPVLCESKGKWLNLLEAVFTVSLPLTLYLARPFSFPLKISHLHLHKLL